MAYTPTNWVTGDTVTATKMNKLEQGVANAGSALIVDTNGQITGNAGEFEYNETLNATFAEIYDALADGVPVYIRRNIETDGYSTDYQCCAALYSVLCAFKYNDAYRIYALSNTVWTYGTRFVLGQPSVATFSANNPSDYPKAIVNTIPSNVMDAWD